MALTSQYQPAVYFYWMNAIAHIGFERRGQVLENWTLKVGNETSRTENFDKFELPPLSVSVFYSLTGTHA
jgi:hypothetical protein